MYSTANRSRMIGLVASTAMAGALLSGCASGNAPQADVSASKAETALAKGKYLKAIDHAEAAVMAEPRNAAYRATLGAAYLDAGRFSAAATSFDDAMRLGDNSARTALSLALALTGEGKNYEAAALLNDWQGDVATSDLGLALALAGQPERGIHLMSNAIRNGENTAKMRQNLAYAYALAGRWREARTMAAQDVPAGQLGDRMEEWAAMARPEASQLRVANLLEVPAGVQDSGQPTQLALANYPSVEQLASEASGHAELAQAELAQAELAETPEFAPVPTGDSGFASVDPDVGFNSYQAPATREPAEFRDAFAAPAPSGGSLASVTQDTMRFVESPAVRTAPVRQGISPEPAAIAAAQNADGTHLVQLGSFSSEQGARRAWGIYTARYPELAGHKMVISEAVVRGKRFWRVSAAGYDKSSSRAMCGTVKSRSGEGCFAYAEGRPLPGAVDTGVRMARR